jgi:hypothetical protein
LRTHRTASDTAAPKLFNIALTLVSSLKRGSSL